MIELIALLAVAASVVGALLAAGLALYNKRLQRLNASELQYSEAREQAYGRLLAAGDAAWYYGSLGKIEPDAELEDAENLGAAVGDLFDRATDQLMEHSRDLEVQAAVLQWYVCSCGKNGAGPREFDDARDMIVALQREELIYREQLDHVQEMPFSARLRRGHVVHRLPDGVFEALYRDDGGSRVQGAGGDSDELPTDSGTRTKVMRQSRDAARRRLAEWREKGMWTPPPTDRERMESGF